LPRRPGKGPQPSRQEGNCVACGGSGVASNGTRCVACVIKGYRV
jgi:hypothetical protein